MPCLVLATMICAALLCVSLASELPGAEERQNSLPFQKPLHPMNPALAGRGAVNWGAEKIGS
jgi:hypothetical protein